MNISDIYIIIFTRTNYITFSIRVYWGFTSGYLKVDSLIQVWIWCGPSNWCRWGAGGLRVLVLPSFF